MRGLRAVLAALALMAADDASERVSGFSKGEDLQAPARVTETGLYVPGRPGVIDERNRPFSPQYPLWSDGASKARWVYLPPGTTIDATKADEWDFPVGTRFWKEFEFNGHKVETRFLWRASRARWVAASYVWNEQGTEATLAPESGVPAIVDIAEGRRHSIPSRADCAACHGQRTVPLGFNSLQLSTDRDSNAIHAEPLTPDMLTLKTLVKDGLLFPASGDLVAKPPRIDADSPSTRAALGYLSANCGSCHNNRGEISVVGPSLRYTDLLQDGDGLARSMVDHPTKWQVPGRPDGTSVLVDLAAPESSALLVRMRSRRPSSQMPPLGTVMRDQEAIDAITRWITHDLARSPEER